MIRTDAHLALQHDAMRTTGRSLIRPSFSQSARRGVGGNCGTGGRLDSRAGEGKGDAQSLSSHPLPPISTHSHLLTTTITTIAITHTHT